MEKLDNPISRLHQLLTKSGYLSSVVNACDLSPAVVSKFKAGRCGKKTLESIRQHLESVKRPNQAETANLIAKLNEVLEWKSYPTKTVPYRSGDIADKAGFLRVLNKIKGLKMELKDDDAFQLGDKAWKYIHEPEHWTSLSLVLTPFDLNDLRREIAESARTLSTRARVNRLATELGIGEDKCKDDYLFKLRRSIAVEQAVEETEQNTCMFDPKFQYFNWKELTNEGNRTFLHNPNIDRLLTDDIASKIKIRECPYEEPQWLAEAKMYMLHRAFSGIGDVYDGQQVGLASDLNLDRLQLPYCSINVHKTSYYQFMATNLVADLKFHPLNSSDTLETLFDGPRTVNPTGSRTLKNNQCANTIGVATMIISSDDQLLVHYQSFANNLSPGKIVPVSGSVDFDRLAEGDTLSALLKKGILKEIEEECHVPLDFSLNVESHLIGHTVELNHAFKPDFYFISFIDAKAQQVKDWSKKPQMEVYGGGFTYRPLNLGADDRHEQLKSIKEKYKGTSAFLRSSILMLEPVLSKASTWRSQARQKFGL